MSEERHHGLVFSALLHFLLLLLAIFGLPLLSSPLPPEPMVITVELLPISDISNVKPANKPISPEEKKDEKNPDNQKPTPPVKTAENTPPPKEEAVPNPDLKKPEEKKEEKEKKDKKKNDDLSAVLKAVREQAEKEKAEKEKKNAKAKESETAKSKAEEYNPGLPLSISEMDMIRSQIAKCWNVPAGAKDAHELVVVLNLELTQEGALLKVELANVSKDRYNRDSFFRAAADSAIRAVKQCSPLKNLPPDKYNTWRMLELSFDPKEMLF